MAVLIVRTGDRAGERIAVGDGIVLGREGADVRVDDPEVSRRHVAVRPCEGGVEVEDLDSKNGSWIDDERVDAVRRLTGSGALLKLGDSVFEIDLEIEQATNVRERPAEAATTVRHAVAAAPQPPAGNGGAVPVQPFGAFNPAPAGGGSRRRRAATRLWVPAVASYTAVAATAAALIVYFAGR